MIDTPQRWIPAPQTPILQDGEIHIWRFPLALTPSRSEVGCLSADENARASRFYFPKDRDHFLAARARLRGILARYLWVEPGQLSFTYSEFGKPELSGEFDRAGLKFNLSHAHELGLLAVALRRPVGVDVEYLRDDLAGEELARRVFSPVEVASWLALPASMRTRAFFTCWTRKEALIKTTGEGLSIPLQSFDVTFLPGETAAVTGVRPDAQESGRWSLHHLEPGPGYVGAVAVRGPVEGLVCWE